MTKIYNKLVRDKILEIIEADDGKPKARILGNEEYLLELVKKLNEECREFTEAMSLEELADVLEVVLALADVVASRGELEKVRAEKALDRGAFKKKIFLEQVD